MANKMLIDATHAEETRVVVLKGNRVEEFDFESAAKKQLRGNIYLAKVTRVEPSLQAAFVDYGGNRHGFLPFSEIHPDYYQIPVADRQALVLEEARAEAESARGDAEERPTDTVSRPRRRRRARKAMPAAALEAEGAAVSEAAPVVPDAEGETLDQEAARAPADSEIAYDIVEDAPSPDEAAGNDGAEAADSEDDSDEAERAEEAVEAVGGADALEEAADRPRRIAPRRYKIQEVIKRRQVLLVQVVKEERGNKGAALTTYLSLAGRYSVLMPNTARGGGISRKITSSEDRQRLKEIAHELEVPEGMGVILRTAGASRTKAEVKRDFEYLMRLWETVAELTLKSQAPMLVYEEGSLVKRAIRDLYGKDIDEVIVAGEEGYREAKDFMRMLMPSHAKNVKQYKDEVPLFTASGIESQLDQMFQPRVQLRSGGYIVINQTEALVSIDVNSGRSTREHNIEDTALKTNLEAAEEVARQLRLRDLAGLIVIDFIDMEEMRNNRAVERRLKDCLKQDRARIQVGRISHFGLLEMSRQRIRTSVLESTSEPCPHCGGLGHVRSSASTALQILRMIEEALIRVPGRDLTLRTRTRVALYVLNQKRLNLHALEERFGVAIVIEADESLPVGTTYVIERGDVVRERPALRPIAVKVDSVEVEEVETEAEAEDEAEPSGEAPDLARAEERGGNGERRRRHRRRGRGGEIARDAAPRRAATVAQAPVEDSADAAAESDGEGDGPALAERGRDEGEGEFRRRRRGRRGGRRNRRDENGPTDGERGERPFVGVVLRPVTWARPGEAEAAPEPTPARRIEIAVPAAPPEAVASPPPPPLAGAESEPEEGEPVMPKVPDLPELHMPDAPPTEDDPNRPRRAGWWSRKPAG